MPLGREPVGEQRRLVDPCVQALRGRVQRPRPSLCGEQVLVRRYDVGARSVERRLHLLEARGLLDAATAVDLREIEDLRDVPVRVVVGEQCAPPVTGGAARLQVAGR